MAAVSPTLKIRCPYCWRNFHPGDCAVFSTISNPPRLIFHAPKPGTPEYEYSRTRIIDLKGPELALEMPVRQCPNPNCQEMLFEGIEECDNINIAIVGDATSGKTHYIAVLIDQLEKGIMAQNGNALVQLIPRNRYTEVTYRNTYYNPIIRDHESQRQTLRGVYDAQGKPERGKPLVYLLRMQDNATRINKMLNLLLFDISGEDLADDTMLVQFGEHVLRADGIIYLADPMSMEYMRQQIPVDLQALPPTGRSAQKVLANVAYRLEWFNNMKQGEKITIPTAIALSKSDLLQYVISDPVERSDYWLFYSSHNDGKAHMEDIRHIDQEVRSILRTHGENGLLNMDNLFEQVSFFAVSATGSSPDKFTQRYNEIKPNRCLDPFVWLLWKRKFLQAVR